MPGIRRPSSEKLIAIRWSSYVATVPRTGVNRHPFGMFIDSQTKSRQLGLERKLPMWDGFSIRPSTPDALEIRPTGCGRTGIKALWTRRGNRPPDAKTLTPMAARGVEPRRLSAQDPKSCVSANFTKRPSRRKSTRRVARSREPVVFNSRRDSRGSHVRGCESLWRGFQPTQDVVPRRLKPTLQLVPDRD